jgi:hypothetical protein
MMTLEVVAASVGIANLCGTLQEHAHAMPDFNASHLFTPAHVVSASLLLAGVIHLLPLPGLLGAAHLRSLYGVPLESTDLVLLLQHRAVLFGLLGAYLIYAAFAPAHQPMAFVAGLASVLAFLALAWSRAAWLGDVQGPAVQRVVVADLIALAALLAGVVAFTRQLPEA